MEHAGKKVVLYVEGGGDSNLLHIECRKGFNKFLEKAGLKGCMPRIRACGSRSNAYERFESACKKNDEYPFLLVDSERAVQDDFQNAGDMTAWQPWKCLGWNRPDNTADVQCHLMVECMENWFLADSDALQTFFGQGFNKEKLSAISDSVETIRKQEVYNSLNNAIKNVKVESKRCYKKGKHSFEILQLLDSEKVISKSKWADRFITLLRQCCAD